VSITRENLYGNWVQITGGDIVKSIQFTKQNELLVSHYANSEEFYKAQGSWYVAKQVINVTLDLAANQRSQYHSNHIYNEVWRVEKLLKLVVDGRVIRLTRQ